MKEPKLVSARFDLPFYLRLPCEAFLSFDRKYDYCAIIAIQKFGESGFKRRTDLAKPEQLLDDMRDGLTTTPPPTYKYKMTNVGPGIPEIASLHLDVSPTGGYRELRTYSEVIVFAYVVDEDPFSESAKQRIIENLNHFLDLYRLLTEDPYVHRIDRERHLSRISQIARTIRSLVWYYSLVRTRLEADFGCRMRGTLWVKARRSW